MKKTFLILIITIILLSSCEVIQSVINYFIDIEASNTTGTVNTDFVFTANTNDVITDWIIDGTPVLTTARTISDNELSYSFNTGNHLISVITHNGAMDEIEINVSGLETVFSLSAYTREATTEIYLDYPILTISGIDYDIENTEDLNITETEFTRIVNLNITVDQIDSFCFVNDNAMQIHNIDLNNMSIADMTKMIEILFPERYEPEIPDFTDTVYSLTGHTGSISDRLTVFDDRLQLTSEVLMYVDYYSYGDGLRYVGLNVTIDNSDSFLFVNNNMLTFFGIDLSNMSLSELGITADILNRYPEEGILVLQEVY